MEFWMTNLPEQVTHLPLTLLSIPGSHDSTSYAITAKSPLTPDCWSYGLMRCWGSIALKYASNWSRTQDGNLTDQMLIGIRYFDLRVLSQNDAGKQNISGDTHTSHDSFFFVHGQLAHEVTSELISIRNFLQEHPKEVVLLDFNHFYEFSSSSLLKFAQIVSFIFRDMLAPFSDKPPSLSHLWANSHQVVCFFHCHSHSQLSPQLWPGSSIHSPWPNTSNLNEMFAFLEDNGPKDQHTFHVSQNILTPDMRSVIPNLKKGLVSLAGPAGSRSLDWIVRRKNDLTCNNRLNIVIVDYAARMFPEIAMAVVSLNFKV